MIADRIWRWAKDKPDQVALQIKNNGNYEKITYEALRKKTAAVAARLKEEGIKSGDSVVLYADNSPQWVEAYLGIHMLGAVVVALDAQYGANEIKTFISFSDAQTVITDADRLSEVQNLIEMEMPGVRVMSIDPDDRSSIVNAPDVEKFESYEHKSDDLMSIIFTSGTTGDPKGVELTVGNISSNIDAVLKAIKIRSKDNILNLLPLHHVYSCTVGLIASLVSGATVTFCGSLKGPDIMETMQDTGVTIFPGVPKLFTLFDRAIFQKVDSLGFVQRMLFSALYNVSAWFRKHTGVRLGKYFFRSVHRRFGSKFRFMASGGAKLDKNVCERLLNIGFLIIEGYGLTETSPVISFTPLSNPTPGSVGLPVEGVEVKIESPDSQGVGEICVTGPGLMKGYHKNEKATAEVIIDGYLHTGDLGYIDEGGMINITGRAKEVIVLSSGKNIYPEEVEKHYADTPMVKEICVMAADEVDGGVERLRAVVVPDKMELAARHVVDARERIRSQLAIVGAKIPSYMQVTDLVLLDDDLPRTRLGKLRRSLIVELVKEKMKGGEVEERFDLPPELTELLEAPRSKRFMKRLSEVTGNPGPFMPGQDLAVDLGVDSLTKMQIVAMVEQEFGVKLKSEELAEKNTVGDFLELISEAQHMEENTAVEFSWSSKLREAPEKNLDELFNLKRGLLKRFSIRIGKGFLYVLLIILFRVRIKGLENIPLDRPVLICPNHQSYLDPGFLYALLPYNLLDNLLFLGFGEEFRRAPLSWVVGIGRVIFTGAAGNMFESLKLSFDALERGKSICIFPEGGRAVSEEFMEPRPGAGILSIESGTPIVPVYIHGAHKTLSPMEPRLRLGKVTVTVGKPIEPPGGAENRTLDDYTNMTKLWLEAVEEMKKAHATRS